MVKTKPKANHHSIPDKKHCILFIEANCSIVRFPNCKMASMHCHGHSLSLAPTSVPSPSSPTHSLPLHFIPPSDPARHKCSMRPPTAPPHLTCPSIHKTATHYPSLDKTAAQQCPSIHKKNGKALTTLQYNPLQRLFTSQHYPSIH